LSNFAGSAKIGLMQHKPFVSVIISTFNRGWILSEAVDSVLSQDYAPFELVVVDDGSTDDTAEILSAYADPRLRVHFQPNRGVSAARNCGIMHTSGELIAFLDSDDLWLPGKLSAQVQFFQQHPDALICQTEEIWIRNKVRVNPKNRHQKPSGDIFRPSLALCLVSPSAVMIRRSLLDEVGLFDESLPACEDYDLWLRISCKHPVHLMETALIFKRGGHEDQLSRAPSLDRFRIRSIEKLLQAGGLSPDQRLAAIEMLKEKCRIYANGCTKRGKLDEAGHYLNLARSFSLPGEI
jgi:glycosyltransferase involved in cell wall biosynthesis